MASKKKPVAKKKPAAKAKPAKKPAPKPAKKVVPKTKPVAKAKAPAKIAAKGKVAPAAKGKAPIAPAKGAAKGKAAAPVAPAAKGKSGKAATKADPALSHEAQRKLLESHRQGHHQASPIEAPVARPKLLVFTVDDVREYLKGRRNVRLNLWIPDEERKSKERGAKGESKSNAGKPNAVGAASLASLFGFNPFKKADPAQDARKIPEKFRRYHKLLTEMRAKLERGLALHTEEALKKSGKDDAGDLSGYSQHMADAGTDTADRDFALSLISSEQQTIKEIDDAIERIKQGTYGVCEVTGRPIPPARLVSVPFTRYTVEGQRELERQRRAMRRRGGNPLGADGDEVGFGTGGGGGEGDPEET